MRLLINLFATNLLKNISKINSFGLPKQIFQQSSRFSVDSASNMSALLVGVCQMTSGSDVGKNIEVCKRLITKAKHRGAKVS